MLSHPLPKELQGRGEGCVGQALCKCSPEGAAGAFAARTCIVITNTNKVCGVAGNHFGQGPNLVSAGCWFSGGLAGVAGRLRRMGMWSIIPAS